MSTHDECIESISKLFRDEDEVKTMAESFARNPTFLRGDLMGNRRAIAWLVSTLDHLEASRIRGVKDRQEQIEHLRMKFNELHDRYTDLEFDNQELRDAIQEYEK